MNSIQILYTCTRMRADLKINDSCPSSFQEVNFEIKKERRRISIILPTPHMFLFTFEVLSFCHILSQYKYMAAITYVKPSQIFFQIDITDRR